jgi:hypothetical protein
MERVGLPCAPADAVAALRQIAAVVTECKGGRGAVREVCDCSSLFANKECSITRMSEHNPHIKGPVRILAISPYGQDHYFDPFAARIST